MPHYFAAFATFPDRATADRAVADLPQMGLRTAVIKRFEFSERTSKATIIDGLMSNGSWAESDVRRGLQIGIGIGAPLGAVSGAAVCTVLELSGLMGFVCGALMGTLIGATTSGIVGAGLVNPRLLRAVEALEPGQVLVSVSCRSEGAHRMAVRLLQTGSLSVSVDRRRRGDGLEKSAG